jgi:2-hydroxy-3-oxopropionate reductase
MRIGFIGLGVMGRPMAARLLAAGHELRVFNRSVGPMDELEAAGAQKATSAADASRTAEAVITMLPDSPQVEEVLRGDGGLFAAAPPGTLVIDMSTSSPSLARELATEGRAMGLVVLDAPVSGGDVGAHEGTLSIMVGGDKEGFERAAPLLGALGSSVTHVGGPGAGQVVKACNQIAVALIIEAISEALTLGKASGIDPERLLDVLGGGLASNRFIEVRRQNPFPTTSPPASASISIKRIWRSPSASPKNSAWRCPQPRSYPT